MSLVSGSIPSMINGVSQQPPSLRLKTQGEVQKNGLSSVVNGLLKRPPTELVKRIPVAANTADAFFHTLRRDADEFYFLVITETTLSIYDSEGVERTVTDPSGAISYLTGLTDPRKNLKAVTIADSTFILNKETVVGTTTETSPVRNPEALVYVKQGDYSNKYTVKITRSGTEYTRSITTMASTQSSTTLTNDAELSIQTDRIAANLNFNSATDATYYGTASAVTIPGINISQHGSVLHFQSSDATDFDVEVEDSRGNQNILAFKNEAPDFKKLPPQGPDGFVIAVSGNNEKGQDDYYVKLITAETGNQVWKETAKPGVEIALDPATMPHKIVSNGDGTFTLERANYAKRKVGDLETNPWPSFVGEKLNDLFFHQNRLGLLALENVIFGEAGEFVDINFFRRTTLTGLDSDPIDVAVSSDKVSILRHAVPFNESLILFSDITQFRLSSEDLLTPETISINVSTQFEASLDARPVGAGKYVFFPFKRGKYSGIREYFVDSTNDTQDAADITAQVPEYIDGTITTLTASSNLDMLVVFADGAPSKLYPYTYYWSGNEKLQSSWSEWDFSREGVDRKVLAATFDKSSVYLLFLEDSSDLVIERMTLSADPAEAITSSNIPIHLDSRVTLTDGDTIPTDDGQIWYVSQGGVVLSNSEVQEALTAGETVYAGYPYEFLYTFSKIQLEDGEGRAISQGTLKLRRMTIAFSNTSEFDVEVALPKRDTYGARYSGLVVDGSTSIFDEVAKESGDFSFTVMADAKTAQISIKSISHLPCEFQSAEWEGSWTLRNRRL